MGAVKHRNLAPIPKMRTGINDMATRMREFGAIIEEKGVSSHETRTCVRGMGTAFPATPDRG